MTRDAPFWALVTLHTLLLETNVWDCLVLGEWARAQLQEAAERQGGHVGLPPALRLLLHILLEFDPARCLPPLRLLVFVQQQLIQLHKHLGVTGEGVVGRRL